MFILRGMTVFLGNLDQQTRVHVEWRFLFAVEVVGLSGSILGHHNFGSDLAAVLLHVRPFSRVINSVRYVHTNHWSVRAVRSCPQYTLNEF